MSLGRYKFQRAFEDFSEGKRDEESLLSGILGLPTGAGQNTVEVDGRIGFVYVRLRDNLNEVIQAYNDKVSPVYGLPVLVGRDKTNTGYYRIVTRDVGRYQNWETVSPYLPRHGNQHRFKPESGGGGDVVFVEGRQFVPLALTPSGTVGSGNVIVQGSHFYTGGEWKWAGDTGTPDILAFKPLSGTSNVVLVYIDGADNNPKLLEGLGFDPSISGTANIIPFLPPVPTSEDVPLGAIQLVSGTERIAWEQIYDLRPYIVGSAYIPTGTYGHIIRDEGMDMSKRSYLNFIGTNVWVNDDPTNDETEIIISGTAGAGVSRRTIKDEGVAEPDRDNTNFIGNGVFVNDDAGNDELEIIISGSSSRYGIRDEGVPQTQRGWLNFVGDGVSVNDDPANDELEIIITGSAGGSPGGNNAYVQFNDGGAFGGDDGLQWAKFLQTLNVGGWIKLADKTAGSPSYSFTMDSNTGFYRDGTDTIGISAGGVVRAKVHTDRVEILTDLNVSGTSYLNGSGGVFVGGGDLIVDHTNTGSFRVRKDGAGGDVFIVDTIDSNVYVSGTLRVGNASENIDDTRGIQLIFAPSATIDGDFDSVGLDMAIRTGVAATKTNTGAVISGRLSALADTGLAGDLAEIRGFAIQSGNLAGAGTITDSYVLHLRAYYGAGTVTNSYGIFIRSPRTGGTVINEWGIYVQDDAPNYFAGRIGIGTDDPNNTLDVRGDVDISGADGSAALLNLFVHSGVGNHTPRYQGVRSRGTKAVPTIVSGNDNLLSFTAIGYDGNVYTNAAQILFEVDGTPGANDMPGRIILSTTRDGATGVTEILRISSEGGIYISEIAAADSDIAGKGQLWVRDDSPNVLMFTDDAGNDYVVDLTPA